jgi:hypothetical protein
MSGAGDCPAEREERWARHNDESTGEMLAGKCGYSARLLFNSGGQDTDLFVRRRFTSNTGRARYYRRFIRQLDDIVKWNLCLFVDYGLNV